MKVKTMSIAKTEPHFETQFDANSKSFVGRVRKIDTTSVLENLFYPNYFSSLSVSKHHPRWTQPVIMVKTEPDEKKICSVCEKSILRPRRFLLNGFVTVFCSTCAKNVPKTSFGDHGFQLIFDCVWFPNYYRAFFFSYWTVDESMDHIICNECCEIFASSMTLKQHSEAQHSLQKREFRCTQCEKTFNRKGNLDRHFKRYHGDINTEQMTANSSQWVLVDQENLHVAQTSSDMELENSFSHHSGENSSNKSNASEHCSPVKPCKCRASKSVKSLEICRNDK